MRENFGGIFAKPNVPSFGSGREPVLSKSLWYRRTPSTPVSRLNRYFSATQARGPKPNGEYDCVGIDEAFSPNHRDTLNFDGSFHAAELCSATTLAPNCVRF